MQHFQCMSKPPLAPEVIRKTVALPSDLWSEIAEFRHAARCGTEAEAFRRLLVAGLKSEGESGNPAKNTKRGSGAVKPAGD
jgi:hypothetical protein